MIEGGGGGGGGGDASSTTLARATVSVFNLEIVPARFGFLSGGVRPLRFKKKEEVGAPLPAIPTNQTVSQHSITSAAWSLSHPHPHPHPAPTPTGTADEVTFR